MKFLISGADNTALTTGVPGTRYNFIAATHASSWNTTETARDTPVAAAMTLLGMVVRISTAPGAGDTRVFTVMLDGVATAAAVTISDANTQNTATFSVSATAGQTISLRSEATGTPADTTDVYWSILAESVTTDYCVIFGGSGTSFSTLSTQWIPLQNGTGDPAEFTNATDATEVFPLAGDMTVLYCQISGAPGSGGDKYDFTINKNGSASTLATSFTDAETGTKSVTSTVSFAAGDTTVVEVTPTSIPTARTFAWSVKIVPTTVGESPNMFADGDPPSTSATEYQQPFGSGNGSWVGTESTRNATLYDATLIRIYALVGTAPANGAGTQTWTFTLRDDSVDTSATVTLSEAETTKNASFTVSTTSGHIYTYSCTPASTPAAMTGGAHLSLCVYFAPSTAIKTINGLAKASVKTVNDLAIASVKTKNGLA